jgi:hypothetical protein
MKIHRIITVPLILILFSSTLTAQDNNCSIKKSFPVKNGTTLRLSNKFGDVNILTGKDDSLLVCATITIVQDNREMILRNMKLINISIDKLKDTIIVSTTFDKKFFSEESRLGRKSFSVDYFIKMPSYIDLKITDEFGNVSLDELSGSVNVRLSQGTINTKSLTKGNVKPINTIYVDHGKVSIDELNWATLSLFNCSSVNIEKAQAMLISSSISKIRLGDISSLVSNSKSDSYIIKSVNNINSESTYSEFEIGKLNGQLKSKATYGSITISDLNKDFTGIDITSGQAQISVKTGHATSFKTDIIASDAVVVFPPEKYPGFLKTESNFSTTILGIAGNNKEPKSMIKIRTTSGKITIQ